MRGHDSCASIKMGVQWTRKKQPQGCFFVLLFAKGFDNLLNAQLTYPQAISPSAMATRRNSSRPLRVNV